jgi:hypothetical protein
MRHDPQSRSDTGQYRSRPYGTVRLDQLPKLSTPKPEAGIRERAGL